MQDHLLEEHSCKVMRVKQVSNSADADAVAKDILPNKARSLRGKDLICPQLHGRFESMMAR